MFSGLPVDLYDLLESSWDESTVRRHLHIHGLGGRVDKESYWAVFAWIFYCELGVQVALKLIEDQFLRWLDINEVRTNVDSRLEGKFVRFRTLLL